MDMILWGFAWLIALPFILPWLLPPLAILKLFGELFKKSPNE